ncbi:MAG: hypothetical protein IT317_05695 [Anaerolineales bacterium]|nr:hypothetical protein [Anaerolineales bacterium]
MIWLFPILALLAFGYAGWRGGWRWALLAAMLYGPLALYLAASPNFRLQGLLAWLCFVLAALALRGGRRLWALLLAAPPFALAVIVAALIWLTNPR